MLQKPERHEETSPLKGHKVFPTQLAKGSIHTISTFLLMEPPYVGRDLQNTMSSKTEPAERVHHPPRSPPRPLRSSEQSSSGASVTEEQDEGCRDCRRSPASSHRPATNHPHEPHLPYSAHREGARGAAGVGSAAGSGCQATTAPCGNRPLQEPASRGATRLRGKPPRPWRSPSPTSGPRAHTSAWAQPGIFSPPFRLLQ